LALKWHPKLSKDNAETSLYNFNLISEAYEVLSCPIKRAFYDKYGLEKLKEGFFLGGTIYGGYQYSSDPFAIFNNFFNENNPFSKLYPESIQNLGSLFGSAFGGKRWQKEKAKPAEELPVEISLEEAYNGCAREVRWEKIKVGGDGVTKFKETCSK
jgi:DnaJ homolog subfamily B member 13